MSGNKGKMDKSLANKAKLEKKKAEIEAKKRADPNKTYVGRGTKTFQKERSKEDKQIKKDWEEGRKFVIAVDDPTRKERRADRKKTQQEEERRRQQKEVNKHPQIQKIEKEIGEFKKQQLKARIEQTKLNSNAEPFYPSTSKK